MQKGETHNFVDLDLFVYLVEMEQQTNVAIFPNGERKILWKKSWQNFFHTEEACSVAINRTWKVPHANDMQIAHFIANYIEQ